MVKNEEWEVVRTVPHNSMGKEFVYTSTVLCCDSTSSAKKTKYWIMGWVDFVHFIHIPHISICHSYYLCLCQIL